MSERLAEIEARVEGATYGEWWTQPIAPWKVAAHGREVAYCGPQPPDPHPLQAERDADFIAAARSDIPWLLEQARFNDGLYENLAKERDAAKRENARLLEREKKLREALVDLHESLFIGSERGLSKEALGEMAKFAKAAALADSGEASGEAAESTDDQPPREDGAYDPRPDPRTHPEFWTE